MEHLTPSFWVLMIAVVAPGLIAGGLLARCGALTREGTRCQQSAKGIRNRCWQHAGWTRDDGIEVVLLVVALAGLYYWCTTYGSATLIRL